MDIATYSKVCVHAQCPFSIRVPVKGKTLEIINEHGQKQVVQQFVDAPCGKCLVCLYKRAQQWVQRLKMSCNSFEQSLFVTLTYNDSFLPQYVSPISGVISDVLEKHDLQCFMKRLRNNVKKDFGDDVKIKYFGVGEYGSESKRPHYHLIIMGLPTFTDKLSAQAYLEKAWAHYGQSLGFVQVGKVSSGRIAYICKYLTISRSVPLEFLEDCKCDDYSLTRICDEYQDFRPFMTCSKGIGIEFLTENMYKWIHDNGRITYYDVDEKTGKSYEKALPTYLLRKIYTEDELMEISQRKSLYRAEMDKVFNLEVRKWWKSKGIVNNLCYSDYFDIHDNPIFSFHLDECFSCVKLEFKKMLYRAFVKARLRKKFII